MLDFERVFKIKIMSRLKISRCSLTSAVIAFEEFCMEKRYEDVSNIFKTTNVTKLTKAISKSSYRVLQVTSKWKTLKQLIYFLKAVEFWTNFGVQIGITLAIFREKL